MHSSSSSCTAPIWVALKPFGLLCLPCAVELIVLQKLPDKAFKTIVGGLLDHPGAGCFSAQGVQSGFHWAGHSKSICSVVSSFSRQPRLCVVSDSFMTCRCLLSWCPVNRPTTIPTDFFFRETVVHVPSCLIAALL
ncbi:hypothetical protein HHI36_006680 [Cryptolaemus montrouzieri]|uniref:Secreted protein n=1 Tax=Cryptolaemus montrouzieri TaxID=559131 RepID=A0ABD2NYU1_9CUCU